MNMLSCRCLSSSARMGIAFLLSLTLFMSGKVLSRPADMLKSQREWSGWTRERSSRGGLARVGSKAEVGMHGSDKIRRLLQVWTYSNTQEATPRPEVDPQIESSKKDSPQTELSMADPRETGNYMFESNNADPSEVESDGDTISDLPIPLSANATGGTANKETDSFPSPDDSTAQAAGARQEADAEPEASADPVTDASKSQKEFTSNSDVRSPSANAEEYIDSERRKKLSESPPSEDWAICVCALDFDETLRVVGWEGESKNEDTPAEDAAQVIRECKSKGCKIAIASANGNRGKLTKILPLIDSETFTDDFFNSDAFQYGMHDKEIELRRIMSYFSAPANCVAFFDDMEHNRVYAARADGVHFEKVDGKTGVTMWNFDNAMKTLSEDMGCPNIG